MLLDSSQQTVVSEDKSLLNFLKTEEFVVFGVINSIQRLQLPLLNALEQLLDFLGLYLPILGQLYNLLELETS